MTKRLTTLFPLWAILLSVVAYSFPEPFAAAKGAITPLLGVVMLGMGMTLTGRSFRLVLRRPRVVATGVGMQFGMMPLLAWAVAKALRLEPALAAGLVLVGTCPGGTASNVIAFLARGDVALSITLTAASTLLSVGATPLLSWLYLGQSIDVRVVRMLGTILWVVLLPVTAGALLNTYFGKQLSPLRQVFPLVSVGTIVVIIAIIVGLTADRLAAVGAAAVAAVALHNAGGLATGYGLGRLLRFSQSECRTLAIEVGMQNSGLGVALASKYFSVLATLPGAVFSVWHNFTGALLAAVWTRSQPRK